MRETSMRGQVLAMSVDHSGVSASSAPNASKTKEDKVEDEESRQNLASAAKSAFEITSVTTAADDELETSVRHPMSADADMLKSSAFKTKSSGESQDNLSISEDQKVEGAVGDKSEASAGETIENTISFVDTDTRPALGGLASHSQTQIQGAVGVNGPNVQLGASRFKRVNNYNRGRWVVRDTSEPEERPESSEPLKGSHMSSKTIAENATVAAGSPPVTKKSTLTEHSETGQHSRSSSDVGPSPPVPVGAPRELREGGGGDSSSEKDAHIDRSSTAGDTANLSRNGSLSSIATTSEQKSLDGDDHLRDTDNESVASSVPGGTTPDLLTYHPTLSTTASAVAPVSTVTSSASALSTQTQEHGQSDSSSSDGKKGQEKTVRTALDTLKTELDQLLENKTQLENLKQQNDTLARDKEMLRRSNEKLQDENSRLQQDKERLEQKVAQLNAQLKENEAQLQQLQQEKRHFHEEPSQQMLQQQQMHLPNTPSTAPVSEYLESPHSS